MPHIHARDVQTRVVTDTLADVAAAAGSNTLLSKTEQKTLTGVAAAAAAEARAAKGPGGRIDVDDVKAKLEPKLKDLFDRVNPPGQGQVWLSQAEVKALTVLDADVGTRAQKAWQIL